MSDLDLEAWVVIDRCAIAYNVCADEIEFRIGDGDPNVFELVTSEFGLENLLAKGTEALRAFRAQRVAGHACGCLCSGHPDIAVQARDEFAGR
ncbi:hypothetical protein [Saccharopolyspora taberi]|uniref:hypothetical protein n=1 Tax=Saccharopolyspora taberi TaxID=60895 RepID=UPI0031D2C820